MAAATSVAGPVLTGLIRYARVIALTSHRSSLYRSVVVASNFVEEVVIST